MEEKIYTKRTSHGTFRSDKPPKFLRGFLKFGAVMFFALAIGSICFLFADFGGDMNGMRIMGVIFPLCFGGFGFMELNAVKKMDAAYKEFCEEVKGLRKKEQAEAEAFKKAHPHLEAENFFKNAKAAGIADLKSEADIARLVLFAKNSGITKERDELIKDFNIGKQDVEHHENKAQIAQLQAEEAELEKKYTRYADIVGSGKTIKMCEDKCAQCEIIIAECEAEEASVERGGEATYLLNKGKESSWAIHGGIANGIAGGAAGLAVASDVQRRNAAVQQQNADLAHAIAQLQVFYLDKIWKRKHAAEDDLKQWNARKEAAKMMLTESLEEQNLLSMLAPTVKSIEQTPTGAVKMELKLNYVSDLKIYGDVDAVIDGSFKVLLKLDGKTVGTTFCVADFDGFKCCYKCICTEVSEKADKYDVSFAPHHLWVAENKDFYLIGMEDE